jgi:hypothetical protein
VKEKIREKLKGAPATKYELEIISKEGKQIPFEVNTSVIYEKGFLWLFRELVVMSPTVKKQKKNEKD